MSSGTSFSSDGIEVLSRKIEVIPGKRTEADLKNYYETERCSRFLLDNNHRRVALQFPDTLLCDAASVATILTESTSAMVFILGDTSYGSCCVDEVAAEHSAADCIIHFGPSCLTRTTRLPVLFVFGKEELEVRDCGRAFRESFQSTEDHVLVMYDTVYSYCIDEFMESIADYSNCIASQLSLPAQRSHDLPSKSHDPQPPGAMTACQCGPTCGGPCSQQAGNRHRGCDDRNTQDSTADTHGVCDGTADSSPAASDGGVGSVGEGVKDIILVEGDNSQSASLYNRFGRRFQLKCDIDRYKIFYIGAEGPTLTNLILNYNKCQFFNYNPLSKECRQETLNVNRALRRRYYLVQKAKEARTVGILVGTLGTANYLEIIERLKEILKQSGKKYYTVAVGKLNVPKMANFLEIDVFVLVACPENSLVDSQEFYKPVVTPYEMEIACLRSKEWTGDYSTDYQELLPGAAYHTFLDGSAGEGEPEFSLITGGFVPTKESNQPEGGEPMTLVPRSKLDVALQNPAAAFLHQRSWQGLEQKLGETEVGVAVEGRMGVAAAYRSELSNHQTTGTHEQ